LEILIKNNANINQPTTDDGCTPLIIAVYKGHERIVEFLIKNNASINQVRTDNGATPLYIAI